MLTIDVAVAPLAASPAPVLVVGAFAAASGERTDPPELAPDAVQVGAALGVDVAAELVAAGFDGSPCGTVRLPTRGVVPAATVLVVGLGPAAEVTAERLRRAAGAAANASERVDAVASALHLALPAEQRSAAVQAVAEGFHLGAYRYAAYRSEPRPFELATVTLHAEDDDAAATMRGDVEVARVTAGAAMLARDLVNTPPQDKRPPALADRVVAAMAGLPVTATVLDEHDLAEGGYGGILGVGQGSTQPPRLVQLTYAPAGAERHVVVVGKGITFDTGGLSLKPSDRDGDHEDGHGGRGDGSRGRQGRRRARAAGPGHGAARAG